MRARIPRTLKKVILSICKYNINEICEINNKNLEKFVSLHENVSFEIHMHLFKIQYIVCFFIYKRYLVIPVDLLKYKHSTNNKLVSFTLFRNPAM